MDSNAYDFCSFGCGGEPDNFVPEPTMEGGWLRGDIRFRSPMMQLHQEIVEFCDFLSPTANEEASRNLAIKRVSGVVKRLWPNSKVEVFGSFKTGLYLPSSDIDAVILGSGVISLAAGLYDLSRSLSKEDIAKELKVIANARVPIIKFVEKTSGISFDISFNVENGPNAVSFVKEAILKWPPLRPLCLILKVFLKQRGLNEVYSGGIGSYALLVMLIAMLQDLRDQLAFPEHNLGVLLIQFFYFYGRELNELEFGVCCGVRGTFSKRSKGFLIYNQPHLLSIEDPQAPENDIGKNSFNYFKIKLAFERAYSAMTNRMIIFGPKRSILDTIIEADAILLERKRAHDVDSSSSSLKHGPRELLQSYYGHNKKITWNCQLIDEGDALARGERTFDNGSSIIRKKRKRFSEAESNNEKKLKENYSWK